MVRITEIAFGSPEYTGSVRLRRAILRTPLGLDFDPAELAAESDHVHLAALEHDEVIGILLLVPNGRDCKMRQVAVQRDRQNDGLGTKLMKSAEREALKRGAARMVLHARETAIPFYLRLGYDLEGEPFTEVGLPHRRMVKLL